jgi:hypothetical protein
MDVAQQNMLVLREMLSLGAQGEVVHENEDRWNRSELEVMRQLRKQCIEFSEKIDSALTNEYVTKKEALVGMIVTIESHA